MRLPEHLPSPCRKPDLKAHLYPPVVMEPHGRTLLNLRPGLKATHLSGTAATQPTRRRPARSA